MKTYNVESADLTNLNETEMMQYVEDGICDNIHIHQAMDKFNANPTEYVDNCAYGYLGERLTDSQIFDLVNRVQKWAKWYYEGDEN